MRAVPFSNLNERLYRIVRQTARELDKKAELDDRGRRGRARPQRAGAHRRAARAHAAQRAGARHRDAGRARSPPASRRAGASASRCARKANEIALILSDDGAGLDFERLRSKGLEMGLIAAERGAERGRAGAAHLRLRPVDRREGHRSSPAAASAWTWCKNEISAIGGRIDIASSARPGHHLHHLPAAHPGGDAGGAGARRRRHVRRLLGDGGAGAAHEDRRHDRPVRRQVGRVPGPLLPAALPAATCSAPPGAAEIQTYNSVLLLRSGVQRIALHVDELIGNQEIVVKNIGPQLARVPGVGGATVLADGCDRADHQPGAPGAARAHLGGRLGATMVVKLGATAALPRKASTPRVRARRQVVMVVDDSLTVRKITSRLLEREGYTVLTAKDGVDALEQMRDALPGGDAGRHRDAAHGRLRPDAQRARRPAHAARSRSSSSRRAPRTSTATRRRSSGVNAFLGKPYQEAELLQHVASSTCARLEVRAAGDDRQVPGHHGDRQRRDQPRLPRARPVRRPRRGDQGVPVRAGRRPARPSA